MALGSRSASRKIVSQKSTIDLLDATDVAAPRMLMGGFFGSEKVAEHGCRVGDASVYRLIILPARRIVSLAR